MKNLTIQETYQVSGGEYWITGESPELNLYVTNDSVFQAADLFFFSNGVTNSEGRILFLGEKGGFGLGGSGMIYVLPYHDAAGNHTGSIYAVRP